MSHFSFLEHEWPAVFETASKVAVAVYSGPRTACFYAWRALELVVS
jgi:type I restriction enzyme R subunit